MGPRLSGANGSLSELGTLFFSPDCGPPWRGGGAPVSLETGLRARIALPSLEKEEGGLRSLRALWPDAHRGRRP